MKIKTLAVGILIGIILFSVMVVYAKVYTAPCTCTCQKKFIFAEGFAKSSKEAKIRCRDTCGRNCGGKTECPTDDLKDCEECCRESELGCKGINPESEAGCLAACKKTCEFKKMLYGIRDLIYIVAGIVAAIMLIIHSLRFISSQDPESREDAKKAIFFVIFALIIIGIAGTLVNEFAGKIKPPWEEIELVEGCGTYMKTSVSARNNLVHFTFQVLNNGDKRCKYQIVWKDYTGENVERWTSGKVNPGESTDTWELDRRGTIPRGGYIVELWEKSPGNQLLKESKTKLPSELTCVKESTTFALDHMKTEGNDVTFYLYIKNNAKVTCGYVAALKDANGQLEARRPTLHYNDVDPGNTWETWLRKNKNNLEGGYQLILWVPERMEIGKITGTI